MLSDSTLLAESGQNSDLLESARRVWPRISSYVRRQFNGEVSSDERDRLAVETWETVLYSMSKTLTRKKRTQFSVVDLDAYLIGAFQHRFVRGVRKEKRRSHMVQATSPEELSRLADLRTADWSKDFERGLQVKEIVASMDEWARDVWTSYQYGYSWREIATRYGITDQQAKVRFRYAILKARDRIRGKSPKNSPQKQRREDTK